MSIDDSPVEILAVERNLEKAYCFLAYAQVLGVSKLKARYKTFESKRQLCDSYDLFLADDRVLPLLPKLLGKQFFRSKKYADLATFRRCV
mmetsp:Transcript_15100/g.61818  ORF Transcript_15100/g.61818 Transcript_15100/m.61818 type:complete len:90 (+) Transcript_15100:523-792(+)